MCVCKLIPGGHKVEFTKFDHEWRNGEERERKKKKQKKRKKINRECGKVTENKPQPVNG